MQNVFKEDLQTPTKVGTALLHNGTTLHNDTQLPGSYTLGGCLYAAVGYDGHTRFNSIEKYDPGTDNWSAVGSMGLRRTGQRAQSVKLEV